MASNSARYNQDHYAALKARETARELVKAHNMDYATAYFISFRLWQEALRCFNTERPASKGIGARRGISKIASSIGEKNWLNLPFKEKAAICTVVVRSLLDRKRLMGFISGERTHLV